MQYLHEIGHVASDWPLGLVVALACRAGSLSCRAGSLSGWSCRRLGLSGSSLSCRAGSLSGWSLDLVVAWACRAGSLSCRQLRRVGQAVLQPVRLVTGAAIAVAVSSHTFKPAQSILAAPVLL